MKIGVIGAGYVGLVTAACLAEKGNDVSIYDIDEEKIRIVSDGKVPFFEPQLEEIVKATLSKGHLKVTKEISDAVSSSEVIFIAVGTPQGESDIVNTSYVINAAESIGEAISTTNDLKVIAVKSTVPPGTTRKLQPIILRKSVYRGQQNTVIVSNPEFLKEGDAVDDFKEPDRIIIGTEDPRAERLLKELYAPFMRTGDRLKCMGIESAELTKYAANAMLATRIAFMNEVALLAERIGADIDEVRKGVGSDPRIGPKFLFPGPGFGGSCFGKDLRGMLEFGRETDLDLSIIAAVETSNRKQRFWPADTIRKYFNGEIRGKNIAIWGAAFKPRTDDVRESPALYTTARLLEYGAQVCIYDPEPRAIENFRKRTNGKVFYAKDVYGVLDEASALLILTDWDEFKSIDLERVKSRLKEPVIVDSRNLYSGDKMQKLEQLGFDYISLGRRKILARTQTR